MVSSAALKCSTILAKIRVVFVTRRALLVVEDVGRDNMPTSPFAPNFSKISLRSRYGMPLPVIFQQSVAWWEMLHLLDDKENFLVTSAGVRAIKVFHVVFDVYCAVDMFFCQLVLWNVQTGVTDYSSWSCNICHCIMCRERFMKSVW